MYTYDQRHRVTEGALKDSGNNNVRVYGYTYDAANNLTGKTRTVTSPASSDAWAYTYDNANQQLSVSMNGGTAETRTYDAWGRMATRAQGTSSATFGYRYGGKLYSYATNFAGEAAETMQYRGNMRLYSKVKTGTDPSALRSAWVSPGFYGNAINEEDGTGALTASSVYAPGADVGERLAYTYGALSNGLAAYAYHDQLGSTRAWRWFTKALAGRNEFAPYGEKISGYDSLPRDYALHVQDPYTLCYHAPYREYAAGWARWTTRDPLGMVDGPNMYAYMGDGPVRLSDPLGLKKGSEQTCNHLWRKMQNISSDIHKRVDEYNADKNELPETTPNDCKKPSESRRGHRAIIAELQERLNAVRNEYIEKCMDDDGRLLYPPKPPKPKGPPNSSLARGCACDMTSGFGWVFDGEDHD